MLLEFSKTSNNFHYTLTPYSFTPKMLLQALIQHNSKDDTVTTNLRFSWLQTATSGLYVVYNEFDDSSIGALPKGKEFSIKYSYMFDVFK